MAHFVLGRSFAQLRRYDEAEQAMLIAIRQNPNFREAHLRIALLYERQLNNPELAMRHRGIAAELAKQYRQTPQQPAGNADSLFTWDRQHLSSKRHATDQDSPFITIDTGLPRSGTSMMMQMLSAGGMEIMTDGIRMVDDDNPLGYFELQEATQLRSTSGWIEDASSKAVKIVVQLMKHLPGNRRYRVIVLQRGSDECVSPLRGPTSENNLG